MPTTIFQAGTEEVNKEGKIPNHPYFNAQVEPTNEVFNPETTRWAVFKVKRRAAMNYNSIVGRVYANGQEYERADLKGGKTNDFLYSYNWPHDFFSLIELAKINSITTFNPNYNDEE